MPGIEPSGSLPSTPLEKLNGTSECYLRPRDTLDLADPAVLDAVRVLALERQHVQENEFHVPFRKAPRIIVGHLLVRTRVDELITDSGERFRAVRPMALCCYVHKIREL